jgi:hypothetical protein
MKAATSVTAAALFELQACRDVEAVTLIRQSS